MGRGAWGVGRGRLCHELKGRSAGRWELAAFTFNHKADTHRPPAAGRSLACPTYDSSWSYFACSQVLFDVERIQVSNVSTSAPHRHTPLPALQDWCICVAPGAARRLLPYPHAVHSRRATPTLRSHLTPGQNLLPTCSCVFITRPRSRVTPVLSYALPCILTPLPPRLGASTQCFWPT